MGLIIYLIRNKWFKDLQKGLKNENQRKIAIFCFIIGFVPGFGLRQGRSSCWLQRNTGEAQSLTGLPNFRGLFKIQFILVMKIV